MAKQRTIATLETYLLALKALSDENRLRALLALRKQELCQCQVVELLQLAPSTVSKHLSILKQAGLVESRKVGRWIHFRAVDGDMAFACQLADLAAEYSKTTEQVRADSKRLWEILRIDPERLCESQRCCK